jgi:CDP-paratose 2-epimerase
MTRLCEEITGHKIQIAAVKETRPADLRAYISDSRALKQHCGWNPKRDTRKIFTDIFQWIRDNEAQLKPILG